MREKKAMSLKEAREEGQKLLESANVPEPADDDDDDGKLNTTNGSSSTSDVIVRNFHCCFAKLNLLNRQTCTNVYNSV